MQRIGKILFFAVVFIASFSVWYAPIIFKGYAPYKINEQIVLAKNLSKAGVYSIENDKNVFLASSLLKEQGHVSGIGNRFTGDIYARLFGATGVLSVNELILFSILLNCLSLVIFAFIVYKVFNFTASAFFSLFYILSPFLWYQFYALDNYGFPVFFLSLFFLFYLLGRYSARRTLFFVLAGSFLALAALAREAFFVLILIFFPREFFPAVATKEWLFKKIKFILPALIPVVLIIGSFYLAPILSGKQKNVYSKLFFQQQAESREFSDSGLYLHLYPDIYVFNFEKEKFLADYDKKINQAGFLEALQLKKVKANLGEYRLSLVERLSLGSVLLLSHVSRFISFDDIGGPFVFALFLLGIFSLRGKDKDFFKFLCWWILGTLAILSFVVVVSRQHLIDFNWVVPLGVALGVFNISEMFAEKFNFSTTRKGILILFLVAVVGYNFILADHILFGKAYDGNNWQPRMEAYAEKIKKAGIADRDVIVFGDSAGGRAILNYLTDKSIAIISPNSMEKIIKEKRAKEVFAYFGADYILGYDKNLSQEILNQTGAINISSDSIETSQPPISQFKSFFMGLVK